MQLCLSLGYAIGPAIGGGLQEVCNDIECGEVVSVRGEEREGLRRYARGCDKVVSMRGREREGFRRYTRAWCK